ncbi:DUF4254 domain-containing protein [Nocardia thailandica]
MERDGAGVGLPQRDVMLRAVRGVVIGGDPILRAAHDLSTLHERRELILPGDTSDIDWARARLVTEIDRWVLIRTPPAADTAPMHTESIGAVVDRLALFAALTYRALACGAEAQLRSAQQRLDELACGYDDLVGDVVRGARRLPDAPEDPPSHGGDGDE